MMKTLKEFIAEKLIETEVFEMAQSLQSYKSTIDRILPMLVCHIILIMIARDEGSEDFVKHWKKEVVNFINDITSQKLKTKDTEETRKKHIKSVILDEWELDTNDDFVNKLYKKLYEEGYDLENKDTYKYILDVFHKFQETYLDELIDVLANKNLQRTFSFVEKL